MTSKEKSIGKEDLQSDPLTRTYRIPKSLLHHLEDVFIDVKRELRDEGLTAFEYQILVASLKIGLQDWYDHGTDSQLYTEIQRIIDLKNR